MPLNFNLIKGLLYEKAQEVAGPYVDKLLNKIAPTSSFSDDFTKAKIGNVNNSDNWGTFGTFLAKTAYDVLTQPLNKTNSALPPTTGSVTQFAPAILSAEPPIKEGRPIRRRKAPVRRVPMRRMPARRGPRKIPMRKRKTVAEMTAPKKKKPNMVYRVNI